MRLTISGPPGSGKTTVAEIVAKSLKCKLILTGQVFREQAKSSGMDVHSYNKLAEVDKKIDLKLDEEILRQAKAASKVVVEGRLAGWLIRKNKIPAFTVYITAPANVRAKRIAKREGTEAKAELEALVLREKSEKKRYAEYYGIDVDDMSVYDLVVDSSEITAEKAGQIVVEEAKRSLR